MNTQFKKGILDLCILKAVKDQEMYGFEIIDKLSNLLDINENTIYPILRRLTDQRLFETYSKDSPLGAQRKYYKITKEGEQKLYSYMEDWDAFIKNVNYILKDEKDE
ncbi:PadR family transcriptional regulator [Acholeplasma laidlawii]|uniref:PadR family transcriptional regulator n=1 Tax=Acholeplasma laidlawii TaxID=2148 RepID=UPI0018C2A0DB|nr:PadR family transcriptional regulator [Acholeplasma laidlawii]MBG0762667.1 PadR family transcriptional regulator [Acholeplasma laidlawii]WIF88963.1 PadR family transcriptional regulator [Acholeplasma laidlawii]